MKGSPIRTRAPRRSPFSRSRHTLAAADPHEGSRLSPAVEGDTLRRNDVETVAP